MSVKFNNYLKSRNLAVILLLICVKLFALETYLPDSIAFKSSLEFKNAKEAELVFDITPGYDIYADKIHITATDNSSVKIDEITYPPPISLNNQVLGEYKVYQGIVYIPIPISTLGNGNLAITLHFQGCKGLSYCYPGMTRLLTTKLINNVKLNPSFNSSPKNINPAELSQNSKLKTADINNFELNHNAKPGAENKSTFNFIKNLFSSNSLDISQNLTTHPIITILVFFILGLLISFTPCVFPMFPILLSIVAGEKDKQAFGLALIYILGGACVYALAGILVSYIGISLQAYFQNIWAAVFMAILLSIFSLSLFGVFDIKLPNGLTHKLNHHLSKGGNSLLRTFLIGAISTLILSPCVTAPLAGALVYISTSHNILLGGIALFTFGFGIGFPLLFISLLGNHFLPKSGNWMIKIKQFLGMIMLAMAIYAVHAFLSVYFIYAILGVWIISFAILFYNSFQNKNLRLFFSIIIFGLGGTVIAYPHLTKISAPPQNSIFTTSVTNSTDLFALLAVAKNEKKVVILDFSASWCMACQEMDLTTWTNPQLLALMAKTKNIRVDVSNNDSNTKHLEKSYHVFAPPAVIIIDPNGKIIHSFMANTKAQEIINTLQQSSSQGK